METLLKRPCSLFETVMPQEVGYVAPVVGEYDEAIAFYTNKLNFQLIEDQPR